MYFFLLINSANFERIRFMSEEDIYLGKGI